MDWRPAGDPQREDGHDCRVRDKRGISAAEIFAMKNQLRLLRARRNWSQADLAERLGVSRQTVNAIETGRYDPSLPLAFDIARTFECRIEDIFQPNGDGGPGQQ
jgi:putative transcriptional regulator